MGSIVGIGKRLKRAGLEVVAVEGWRQRGNDDFDPQGAVFHHTASSSAGGPAPSLGIVTHGRAGIPGPLCNLLIARNGKVFLVAAQKANHAGLGGPLRGIPKDSANKYTVGVEVENNGVGEPWTPRLLKACEITFEVILEMVDEKAGRLFGHKEWTSRKIDPANVSMDKTRDHVRELLQDDSRRRRRR